MKKLSDIFSVLTNTEKDYPLLIEVLNQQPQNEDDFFAIMDIARYVKNNYMYHKGELEAKLLSLDKEIFSYLESKVNTKNSKRDWDSMLFYLDKISNYFRITNNVLIFDSIEDFYLYCMLFPQKPVRLMFGIEHWYYLKRGIVYRHKKDYENAILNLQNSIKCAPMSMTPYEELIATYFEQGDYQSAKKVLDNYYVFCRVPMHLGVYYYYLSLYYYYQKNTFVTHICIWYALRFDLSLAMRNSLIEKLTEIMDNKNVVLDAFGMADYKSLNANNIPAWYSTEILNATLNMYKACFVSAKGEVAHFKKNIRARLLLYKLSAYVEQIETNASTQDYMFLLNGSMISLKVDKNWQIIYENGEVTNGVVLELANAEKTLTVNITKSTDNFDEQYNQEITKIKKSGCDIKNEQKITMINKRDVRSIDAYFGDNSKTKLMYLTINDYFITISFSSKNDFDNEKELLEISNSIKTFNNIEKIQKMGKFL